MNRNVVVAVVALGLVACGLGGTDDGTAANCPAFDVTIDSATCRFWDNPDVFASDSWFIDLAGTAKGPSSTEMIVSYLESIAINTACASWGNGYASYSTCISQTGQPTATNWTSTVEVLPHMSETSRSITVTVKVHQVGSVVCPGEKSASKTVVCSI